MAVVVIARLVTGGGLLSTLLLLSIEGAATARNSPSHLRSAAIHSRSKRGENAGWC